MIQNDSNEKTPETENAEETPERERKERVIHTRVPAVLEAELKRFAENLRVPVSNLVRTILEDAVAVADRAHDKVEQRLRTAAKHLGENRPKPGIPAESDPLEGVFGFQELVLNVPCSCAKCSDALRPGNDAYLALTDRPGARMFICKTCRPQTPGDENKKGSTP